MHQNDQITIQVGAKTPKAREHLYFLTIKNNILQIWHGSRLLESKSNYAAKIKPNSWRTHVTIGFRFY